MSCLRITISTHLEIGRSIVPSTNVFQNLCSSEWRWRWLCFLSWNHAVTLSSDHQADRALLKTLLSLMDTCGGLSSALATSFLTLGLRVGWGPCLHFIPALLLAPLSTPRLPSFDWGWRGHLCFYFCLSFACVGFETIWHSDPLHGIS